MHVSACPPALNSDIRDHNKFMELSARSKRVRAASVFLPVSLVLQALQVPCLVSA